MRVLGISAFYHDSAAALVEDGRIVAAAQEERFTRKKHDAGFPRSAIAYCLEEAGVGIEQVDSVVFYEKPLPKFERLLETYLAFAPRGFRSFRAALPLWFRERLRQKQVLLREIRLLGPGFDPSRLLFCEHHLSHAASAFYPSPFEESLVLTMDGVGEWATTSVALGRGNRLEILKELRFPHSLGLLYSAVTYYTGFRVNSGEHKVMGLAPYGQPRYVAEILTRLMDLKEDGTFRLDQTYFDYCTGLRMTNDRFGALFGGPPRRPEEALQQRHLDLAASVQAVTEEVVLRLTRSLAAETRVRNLCLAGGVALNCVANGRVLRDARFDQVWVQPAAGDAGGALGAALQAYYGFHGGQRRVPQRPDGMRGALLGPAFAPGEVEKRLSALGARFRVWDEAGLVEATAEALAEGKTVGWFQGRMEFGPRALGNRSILADPRAPSMQSRLNLQVKFRESFRPFAPAVLAEDVSDWFELAGHSPYMLFAAPVASHRRRPVTPEEQALVGLEKQRVHRSEIPAVTHVNGSSRVQTVHRETNPRFHALLRAFKARTGCPVVVNTSFNVRGEPIVCTPEDAFRCFLATEIDVLVAGNCLLARGDQDPDLRGAPVRRFEPD